MPIIRPSSDLRNNYNEISKICHETKEPMYITRNGTNDLVVLSDEAYDTITKAGQKMEEERIDRLIGEHFDKYFATFKEFKADLEKVLEQAHIDIKEGHYQTMEEFCAEMEEKYDIK